MEKAKLQKESYKKTIKFLKTLSSIKNLAFFCCVNFKIKLCSKLTRKRNIKVPKSFLTNLHFKIHS